MGETPPSIVDSSLNLLLALCERISKWRLLRYKAKNAGIERLQIDLKNKKLMLVIEPRNYDTRRRFKKQSI